MYPRLVVDLKKLRSNLDACAKIVKEDGGCSLMIVTKGLCADPEMARMVADLSLIHICSYWAAGSDR